MKKLIRPLILLVVGAAIGAGGYHLYSGYTAGAEMAEPFKAPDLSRDEVRKGLYSENLNTRLAAFEQIGKLPEAERREALIEALEGPLAKTRIAALSALGEDFPTDPAVIERVLEVARTDPDGVVQELAFYNLQSSGDSRVLGMACALLGSADAGLEEKLCAAESLDQLTGRSTVGEFADRLEDAEAAAMDLGPNWTKWLEANEAQLTWDPEKSQFR